MVYMHSRYFGYDSLELPGFVGASVLASQPKNLDIEAD